LLLIVSAPFIKGHGLRKIIRNYEYEEVDRFIKKFSKEEKLAIW
jgi:hypothetical protein